ncbi:MAG: flavodoxin family protein [Solirubrobacterales bacterium]
MKIVVLFSSPNPDGNTGILLKSFLMHCKEEVNYINVYTLNVKPCTDCRACYKTGICIINDDMNELYNLVENCDAVIIASPMYFTSLPGPLKLVIDRFQAYWSRKFIIKDHEPLKRKRGVLLMTSGVKSDLGFSSCEAIAKQFFSLINADFNFKIYGEETDKYPIKSNEAILKTSEEKGREFCRAV